MSTTFIFGNQIAIHNDNYFNLKHRSSYQINDYQFDVYSGLYVSFDYSTRQLDIFLTILIETDPLIELENPQPNYTVFEANTLNSTWIYLGGETLPVQEINNKPKSETTRENKTVQIHQSTVVHSSVIPASLFYDLSGEVISSTRILSNDSRLTNGEDYRDGILITDAIQMNFNLSSYTPWFVHLLTLFFLLSLLVSTRYYILITLSDLSASDLTFLTKIIPHLLAGGFIGMILPLDVSDQIVIKSTGISVLGSTFSLIIQFAIEAGLEFLYLCSIPIAIEQLFRSYHYYGYQTGQFIHSPIRLFGYTLYTPPELNEVNTYSYDPTAKRKDWSIPVLNIMYSRELMKQQLIWLLISVVSLPVIYGMTLLVSFNLDVFILVSYYIWILMRKVIIHPVNHPDLK